MATDYLFQISAADPELQTLIARRAAKHGWHPPSLIAKDRRWCWLVFRHDGHVSLWQKPQTVKGPGLSIDQVLCRIHAGPPKEEEQDAEPAEVERLQAVVDKLPKTVDGVPIVPGMTVWRLDHPYLDSPACRGEKVFEIHVEHVRLNGVGGPYHSHELASTREAAVEAGEKGEDDGRHVAPDR